MLKLKKFKIKGCQILKIKAGRFSATPPNVQRLWPKLGEHNREVLREAGYSETEIDDIVS